MYPFLDYDQQRINVGAHVEIKHCSGIYGETRTVTGIVEALDIYGGVRIKLDPGYDFTTHGRYGSHHFTSGDPYYVCNAFRFDQTLNARVGRGEHNDFEHGHAFHCKIIP